MARRADGRREHLLEAHGEGVHLVVVTGGNVVALTMDGPSTRDSDICGTGRNTARMGSVGARANGRGQWHWQNTDVRRLRGTMQPARGFAGWWGGGGLGRRWLGCVFDASAEQSTSQKIGEAGIRWARPGCHWETAVDRRSGRKAGTHPEVNERTRTRSWTLGRGVY